LNAGGGYVVRIGELSGIEIQGTILMSSASRRERKEDGSESDDERR
jgi:hypothetical protein